MQLKWRERYIDDETFLVTVKTKFEEERGSITLESLQDHNMLCHIPPQFMKNGPILEAFKRFQNDLADLLLDHVNSFPNRLSAKDNVRTVFLLL